MEPKIAKKGPYEVELEAGKTYHWCACGRSKNQPFCDGSHKGTGIVPVAYTPEKSGKYHLCGCKRTKNPPLCDGTHNTL
ncbi:MAG: CDGSH iron-sulfur domain-containing protein [Bacteroidales bacterium]|jgi:CDGSH-type Zn-finger protein|nr:CDGSH iron-sulfur domain-containing protein [Bacteroidales bacterium]